MKSEEKWLKLGKVGGKVAKSGQKYSMTKVGKVGKKSETWWKSGKKLGRSGEKLEKVAKSLEYAGDSWRNLTNTG